MKKVFFYFAVAATCLLAACARKEAPVTDASDTVKVYYINAQGGESTKSEIDNSSAAFTWSAGDEIAVYTSAGYKKSIELAAGGSASASFAFSEDIDADRADFALFPASLVFDGTAVRPTSASSHSASGLTVTLPDVYSLSDIQDSKSPVPMIAANAPGGGLAFKQLGALLRIQVKNLPKQTDYITFDFNGKKVRGAFTLTGVDPGTTALETAAASSNNDIITVYNDVFTTFQDAIVVNLPVPTGTYTDVTITSWDSDDNKINSITTSIKAGADWVAARKASRKQIASLPVFSVANDKKVVFAPGNLQAVLSDSMVGSVNSAGHYFWGAKSWQFAPNQYTVIGNTDENKLTDPAEDHVVDLFSWVGASRGFTDDRKYGILVAASGSGTSAMVGNTAGEALLADWGNNEIDAYLAGTWRTLSTDDWNNVLNVADRTKTRFTKAQLTISDSPLETLIGLLVFPDQYTHPLSTAFGKINTSKGAFADNASISLSDFALLEAAGCVFLPSAGCRSYDSGRVISDTDKVVYWTSTSDTGSGSAKAVYITSSGVNGGQGGGYNRQRYFGCAVRLARDVN